MKRQWNFCKLWATKLAIGGAPLALPYLTSARLEWYMMTLLVLSPLAVVSARALSRPLHRWLTGLERRVNGPDL